MKKCPRCSSISQDSDNSCGVCGGSLSGVTPESLEQLVHKDPEVKAKKKLSVSGLALIIVSLTMTGVGAVLLILLNALGIFLLLPGLIITVYIFGGAGRGMGGVEGGWRRQRASTRGEEEVRQDEKDRRRRRGEED